MKNKQKLPDSLDGFISLLETAQPTFNEIDVIFPNNHVGDMKSCVIYADGKMKYMLERTEKTEEDFLEEIRGKVEELKNPPRFWRGCRVDLASYLGYCATEKPFKEWFSKYSKQYLEQSK